MHPLPDHPFRHTPAVGGARHALRAVGRVLALSALPLCLAACTTWLPNAQLGSSSTAVSAPGAKPVPQPETLWALTTAQQLIQVRLDRPQVVLQRRALSGLPEGEDIIGMDFRVARGVLFALARSGRLYTVDTTTGVAQAVAAPPLAQPLVGEAFGVDFNPAVDRVRVVSVTGQNLRLHPDTGLMIDGNPKEPGVQPDAPLSYVQGDVNAGRPPAVTAVAYTYNQENEKITTLYGIDRVMGTLVRQGSVEGTQPVVSPDTGRLTTIGSLGTGALLDAAFDISDVRNTALLATRTATDPRTRLYVLDLKTGQPTLRGILADGKPIRGIAIEP